MKLTAKFNGAWGPVWVEVTEVLAYETKWGGFAIVRVTGQVRNVPYRRLRLERI